jgi:hypothetical protein
MPKRMLHLIGALLAVGALAIAPAAATADTSATANASGGGSGCNDNWAPHSTWGNGWYGNDDNGPYWQGWGDGNGYFDGHSWDQGCGNGSSSSYRKGKVARVMVAVQRLRGSQCQHLSRSGDLGRRTDCDPHWFRATGTRHWHHNIDTALPRGRYRLQHRAIDVAGNRGRKHVRRLSIR